jgi:hypothetical protein
MGFVVAEGSAERQFEPGHQPPAAPSPAPPRREARNELKPPTAFRITADRTQRRRPRPGAVGGLDPNDAGSGPDRDRLPRSTRAGVPDRITEDLANQRDRVIPHGCPGSSTSKTNERGARARPPRALPDRRRAHHLPALPRPPRHQKPAGQRADAGTCTLSCAANVKPRTAPLNTSADLVRGLSVDAAPVRGRPCKADGPSCRSLARDSRPPCVRGHRNTAPYSATR